MTLKDGDIIMFKTEQEIECTPSMPLVGVNTTMKTYINTGGMYIVKNVRYYDRACMDVFGIVGDIYTYAADWVKVRMTQSQLAEDVLV